MSKKLSLRFIIISVILLISISTAPKADAYYGLGMMGGLYGMYGGMMGMYGMGLYGMMGGMYGMYGGMMGGLMGMYGGMMGGMYSPFSIANMYYPVETGNGLTYQLPFMMALPYIGISSLYNQLFPNLFNSQSTTPTATAL